MKATPPCAASRLLVALLSTTLAWPALVPAAFAQSPGSAAAASAPLAQEQLGALVAPIALYPDAVLAQLLMASTYPLEVVEAGQWLQSHAALTGAALSSALKDQNWDASVKSLVSFPQVLQMMSSQLTWTQQLGDAFLSQQKDVMAAVQVLRAKAQKAGALKSSSQQTVSTPTQNGQTVIVIAPANPQVVYVPAYNPTVVYGGWPYPAYPPVAYYPPGYVAGASLLSFGAGMAVGAALWGGCHWGGGGSVTVNNNTYNQFNNNNNRNWSNQNKNGGNSNWNHDPQHRGNVPYSNPNLQKKYGANQQQADQQRNQAKQQQENRGATGGERQGAQSGQVKQQENRDANRVDRQAEQDRNSTATKAQKQQQEKRQAEGDKREAERQGQRDEAERKEGGEREGGREERGGGGHRR